MLTASRLAQTRFGRRYGNRPKSPSLEKTLGYEALGSAKVPPIAGPIIVPMLQTKGIIEYARAGKVKKIFKRPHDLLGFRGNSRSCSGFVTNSPTMVWMTPILPFKKPPMARPASATQMLEAKPTITRLRMVPVQPTSRTGFRPTRSDKPPQYIPVRDSASAKAEMSRPA